MHYFRVQSLLPFISGFQWLNMFYSMRQTETRQQLLGIQINAVLSQILIHAVLEGVAAGTFLCRFSKHLETGTSSFHIAITDQDLDSCRLDVKV